MKENRKDYVKIQCVICITGICFQREAAIILFLFPQADISQSVSEWSWISPLPKNQKEKGPLLKANPKILKPLESTGKNMY